MVLREDSGLGRLYGVLNIIGEKYPVTVSDLLMNMIIGLSGFFCVICVIITMIAGVLIALFMPHLVVDLMINTLICFLLFVISSLTGLAKDAIQGKSTPKVFISWIKNKDEQEI